MTACYYPQARPEPACPGLAVGRRLPTVVCKVDAKFAETATGTLTAAMMATFRQVNTQILS